MSGQIKTAADASGSGKKNKKQCCCCHKHKADMLPLDCDEWICEDCAQDMNDLRS